MRITAFSCYTCKNSCQGINVDKKLQTFFIIFVIVLAFVVGIAVIAYSRVMTESDIVLNTWLDNMINGTSGGNAAPQETEVQVTPEPTPTPEPEPTPTPEPVYPIVHLEGAVDLREYLPEAQFDIMNATERNPTGEPLYPPVPLLEEHTAERLKRAYDTFLADGYVLRIIDGYRPVSAQQKLFDVVRNTLYVSNPKQGISWHNIGKAVDITLCHADTGEELEFPSPIHTLDSTSSRNNRDYWDPVVRRNVDYLTNVMTSCGFTTISTEWWHFQDESYTPYMDRDLDLYMLSLAG